MSVETDVKDVQKEAGVAGEIFSLAKAFANAISDLLGKDRSFVVSPVKIVYDFQNGLDNLQASNPGPLADALITARLAASLNGTDPTKHNVSQTGTALPDPTFIYNGSLITRPDFFRARPDLLADYWYFVKNQVPKYGGFARLQNLGTGDPTANVFNAAHYLDECVLYITGKTFVPVGTGNNPLPLGTSTVPVSTSVSVAPPTGKAVGWGVLAALAASFFL